MTRDEALKEAWQEILDSAGIQWAQEQENVKFWYKENFPEIDKAVRDILDHPTEYTAWIE